MEATSSKYSFGKFLLGFFLDDQSESVELRYCPGGFINIISSFQKPILNK